MDGDIVDLVKTLQAKLAAAEQRADALAALVREIKPSIFGEEVYISSGFKWYDRAKELLEPQAGEEHVTCIHCARPVIGREWTWMGDGAEHGPYCSKTCIDNEALEESNKPQAGEGS